MYRRIIYIGQENNSIQRIKLDIIKYSEIINDTMLYDMDNDTIICKSSILDSTMFSSYFEMYHNNVSVGCYKKHTANEDGKMIFKWEKQCSSCPTKDKKE